jgi:uncharacterized protein
MKTKLFAAAFLALFLSAPLFAQSRVVDKADILSAGERAELESLAEIISANYDFDLVIVTEKDIGGGSPMGYADNFFDKNGYGRGAGRDGCLFLQVTGSADYYFSTSGRGIKILKNPTAFKELESNVVYYLRNDAHAGAYHAFLGAWETFLALDAKGRTYNFFYKNNAILVIAAWLLSFLAGFVIVLVWKKQMNTVLAKEQADNFIIPGSLAFTEQTDRFLYSKLTKIAIPKSSSSGGSHISSSGRSHGGGGGKYR